LKQYTLSEFNHLVKSTLEDHLEMSYWIVAEIGELTIHTNGHCYLDLVEKEDTAFKAKLRATIWSYTFRSLHHQFTQATGSELQSGMKILVNASLQFHALYGLSLNIKDIDPNFTIGERARKKEDTIQQLQTMELLGLNGKIALPMVPQRIAVISSATAAGYGDFTNQLSSNEWGYQVKTELFPSVMQGDQASVSIAQNLEVIEQRRDGFDLIVIIRGGGAKTDLDCFDDFELCQAIAHLSTPVITGIGHERDQTIADLVAHTCLKTPTAVAEFILNGLFTFENQVLTWQDTIRKEAANTTSNLRLQLENIKSSINQLPTNILEKENLKIRLFEKVVQSNDPAKILGKGFSITRINGKIINAKTKLKEGDQIETETKENRLKSILTTIK